MKTNKKKVLAAVFASLTALTVSATSFALLNENAAREIAAKWVPEGTIHLQTKDDNTEYEVKFFNEATNVHYRIDVNKLTEAVTEVTTRLQNNHGSRIVSLSEAEAKDIVLNEYPGAIIQNIKLEIDDSYRKYEVKFNINKTWGEVDINPETGVIIKRELKYY